MLKSSGAWADSSIHSNANTLLAELRSCTLRRDLHWGRVLHAQATENGSVSNMYVATALIKMYARCGCMPGAREVFESIQKPNVVSWTALLWGYAQNGEGHTALELYSKMKAHGCAPDSVTHVAVFKACACLATNGDDRGKARGLETGLRIHSEMGRHSYLYVQNALIDMYAKCGSMADARRQFDSIQKPDVVSWNAVILGYAEAGEGHLALELFSKMKTRGRSPDSITYLAVLKACTSLVVNGDVSGKADGLEMGRRIHSEIGCNLNLYVQNTLVDMYSKCGSMNEAVRVFDSISKPDLISWNVLLSGHAENGEGQIALERFSKMKARGCVPNSLTYVAVLKACTSMAATGDDRVRAHCLETGRSIQSEVGSHLNLYVQSALIDMYAKCGCMVDARRVFNSIQKPNVVSWTALILGYIETGEVQAGLELFTKMKMHGCVPDSITYIAVLKACTFLAANGDGRGLETGRSIHSEVGCHLDLHLQSTLIDMYGKCGSMVDARQVFDGIRKPDRVAWSALLLGYAENGEEHVALDLFSRMKRVCTPDSVTYMAVLKACASIGALALGRKFHADISEFTPHLITCLVDFYAKCGSMLEAHAVFDQHARAGGISTWNALLAGYSTYGDTASMFQLFEAMQEEGLRPDTVTLLCMLLCCSHAGLVEKASGYLNAMPSHGVSPTVMHYTCVVDTLGRANQLNRATAMLQKMPCNPDEVIWMTLLGACRKWKNVPIGMCAFQSLIDMDRTNAPAYVLMAHIYGSRGMWEEQDRVLQSRIEFGAAKSMPGQAYVANEAGETIKFVVGEEDLPEVRATLAQLPEELHILAQRTVEEEALCGHCERRAVAYGILRAPPGEPVRAFKSTRTCEDCHEAIKTLSKLSKRVVMLRDASRFHVLVNGSCSCGDYW